MFKPSNVMPITNVKYEISSTMWQLFSLIDLLISISRSMSSESEAKGLNEASESSTDSIGWSLSSDLSSLLCTAQLFHSNPEPFRGMTGGFQ